MTGNFMNEYIEKLNRESNITKYNELEEENYFLKSNKSHDEYIANRIKEFILKTD